MLYEVITGKPGSEARLDIIRDGKHETLPVTIGLLPEETAAESSP